MDYKTFVSMNIAIVGEGEIAEMYATGFALAGHEVYMAWKGSSADSRFRLSRLFNNIHVTSIEEASFHADLVFIATACVDVREVAYWLGDVRRKVIVDVTCNVYEQEVCAINTVGAIQAITGSQHVVKVFNTMGYEHILKPLFKGSKVELIMVGESKKAKEITKIIAVELGIKYYYDFGGKESIPLFNEMTRCFRELALKDTSAKKIPGVIKR